MVFGGAKVAIFLRFPRDFIENPIEKRNNCLQKGIFWILSLVFPVRLTTYLTNHTTRTNRIQLLIYQT